MYYVYKLIDPRNNTVFYIGKGKNDRAHQHVQTVKRGGVPNKNKKLYSKIKSILASGYDDVMYEFIYYASEEEALHQEAVLIESIGLNNLTNISSGGAGGDCITNHPDKELIYKTRRKVVPWNKGRTGVYSEDTLTKMRNSLQGRPPNKGSFSKGTSHREFGIKQDVRRVEKRVNTMKTLGVYDRMKTIMKGNTHAKTSEILQFDTNGNFIREFTSINGAARELGIPRHRISFVLRGKQNQTGGYVFKYKQ